MSRQTTRAHGRRVSRRACDTSHLEKSSAVRSWMVLSQASPTACSSNLKRVFVAAMKVLVDLRMLVRLGKYSDGIETRR